jgi:L-fuconolactonase
MMIDAHQHFWNPARSDYFWMTGDAVAPIHRAILPRDFEAIRARHGIEKTVLVQAAPTIAETEYMLGIADTTEFVAKIVGWIDFENRDDLKQLKRLAKHPKFAGVRPMIQDIPDMDWMHRADVQWAYAAIVDLDLTFDALGFPVHAENFLKLFEKYPNMRVVVDHCLKPQIRDEAYQGWARDIARIARETHAFCKLSGIATEAKPGWTVETLSPYAQHVIDVFGPSRVMWGSDWPVLELNGSYDTWRDAALHIVATGERAQIFGGAAQSFYRINHAE